MNKPEPYRIVVGLDPSDEGGEVLQEAFALAVEKPAAELHLAAVIDPKHAGPIPGQRSGSLVQLADETRDRIAAIGRAVLVDLKLTRPGQVIPTTIAHVRIGPAAEQLAALATEIRAHLVVVGTHGRRGVRRLLLGSVAEKTVRLAPCPVLVVRPRDFSALEGLPVIEPACPSCIEARTKTAGAQWWCDTHQREPEELHIYSRSGRIDTIINTAGTLRW